MKRSILSRSLALVVFLPVALACGGSGNGSDPGSEPDIPFIDVPTQDDVSTPGGDEGGNRPPVLARIGDRVVAVGETLTIALSASDADGDALTFSVYGDVPEGARFDKESRTFTWVPLQAGQEVFLTFVVSDGAAIDRETIRVRVVAEATHHPPILEALSDQPVQVGKPFVLQLQAEDPDGDPLTFGIVGTPPSGATLNPSSGRFDWTPPASVDGTVVKVTFEVRDPGGLSDSKDVRFLVGKATAGSPPEFDPVADQAAIVGKPLTFTVHATDPDGDTVTLALVSGLPATAFDPATGKVTWTPEASEAGREVQAKFSAGDGQFQVFLTVRILVKSDEPPPTCSDDGFEPNNEAGDATPLPPGTYDLSICDTALSPTDIDFFGITLDAGDTVDVTATFEHDTGDLDCDLSRDGSTDTIVAGSAGASGVEAFSWTADKAGTYVLAIYGVANTSYAQPYRLEVAVRKGGTCLDDSLEPNDASGSATAVTSPDQAWADLVLCPGNEDWFALDLAAGDTWIAAATPKSGLVGVEIRGPGGTEVLDASGPGSGPQTAGVVEVGAPGRYLARAWSPEAATYSFEVLVERAVPTCSVKSCALHQVCNAVSGQCVDDGCFAIEDCSGTQICADHRCVDPCVKAADCRTGYSCKAFEAGRHCGVSGNGKTGAACTTFEDCAAGRICMLPDRGGYCAVYGCKGDSDCTTDARCVSGGTFTYCARTCTSDADCNVGNGFACKDGTTKAGATAKMCL